jgi:hypothetical protein
VLLIGENVPVRIIKKYVTFEDKQNEDLFGNSFSFGITVIER